jgi:hypothetical protein
MRALSPCCPRGLRGVTCEAAYPFASRNSLGHLATHAYRKLTDLLRPSSINCQLPVARRQRPIGTSLINTG